MFVVGIEEDSSNTVLIKPRASYGILKTPDCPAFSYPGVNATLEYTYLSQDLRCSAPVEDVSMSKDPGDSEPLKDTYLSTDLRCSPLFEDVSMCKVPGDS